MHVVLRMQLWTVVHRRTVQRKYFADGDRTRCFEGMVMIDDFVDQDYELPVSSCGEIRYGDGIAKMKVARLAQAE